MREKEGGREGMSEREREGERECCDGPLIIFCRASGICTF